MSVFALGGGAGFPFALVVMSARVSYGQWEGERERRARGGRRGLLGRWTARAKRESLPPPSALDNNAIGTRAPRDRSARPRRR